jgi:hypothetical protein
MAINATTFTIESQGLHTPCRLLFSSKDKSDEIVRFEKGLKGPARFSNLFQSYVADFKYFGILVPDDPKASSTLKDKIGSRVVYSDPGFGEAFYRYHFPKMIKHDPDCYHWVTLS